MSQHIGSTHVLNCCVNFAVESTSSSPFFLSLWRAICVRTFFISFFQAVGNWRESRSLSQVEQEKKIYRSLHRCERWEREREISVQKERKKKCNKTIEKVVPSDELIQSSSPWAAFFSYSSHLSCCYCGRYENCNWVSAAELPPIPFTKQRNE